MKIIKVLLLFIASILVAACIDSDIQSYTDPDYKDAKFTRLIVDTTGLSDKARIKATKILLERFKEAKYEVVDIRDIAPPTRTFTNEELAKLLSDSGFDYVFSVVVTGDSASSYVSGVYTYSNAYAHAYGNSASAYGNSYSTPIVSANGNTTVQANIYDAKNMKKAWQATVVTEASGRAFVGNVDAIANSVIGKVIDKLKEEGHS